MREQPALPQAVNRMHADDNWLSRAGPAHPEGRHGGGQPMRVDDIEASLPREAVANGACQESRDEVGKRQRGESLDARMPAPSKPGNADNFAIRELFARWGLDRGDKWLVREQRHPDLSPCQGGNEHLDVRLRPSAIGRGEWCQYQHVPVLGLAAVVSCRSRHHVSAAGPCNRPRMTAAVIAPLTATAARPPKRWRCSEDHAALPTAAPASRATATPAAR